ncbi:MAG: Ig-like domain-containing protein, partial [Thermoanaerobaculia bacterium]|nr:Ig-like domain-containing protein [Thermoanaerobaculia bacterium]
GSRVTLLPAAGAVPAKLVAAPEASGSTLPFPGVAGEGVFIFLHANAPIGFVTGRVTSSNGAGIAGSRVTAAGLGTANLSVPGGQYAVPAPAGAPTLNALHPVLGVAGSGQVPSLAKGQVATLDIVLTPVPLQIRSLQPANGAADQPVGSTVSIAFTSALDPASVTAATLSVSLADAAGAPTGLLFNGSVALSPDRTTVVFTPARPLPPGKRIAARFTGGVRDAAGTLYGGTLPVDWSFTTSTQFVTGGAIHPEKIRILVPVNGVAQIVADDGALPLVTGGTAPWSVWADVEGPVCPSRVTLPANANGGFTLNAGCPPTAPVTISSRVWLHVIDPTGTEAATFRLGPFRTPDGKGFVAAPGDDTVFTTAEGVEVTAPAAAFDVPTLVKVTKQPLDSLAVALNPGLETGAVLNIDFDGTAKETLRVRIPVTTASPVGGLVFAGTPIDLPWGRKLRILDVGSLVDDGRGGKLISTLEADQPEDPAATAITLPSSAKSGGRSALVSRKLLRTITVELTARATVGFVFGATLPLLGITGATVSATLFVLYNALADAMIFQPVASDWSGRYVLPATGTAFTVVKRDLATGWILSEKAYGAVAPSPGRFVNLGELEPASTDPPRLIDASPFAVIRFRAPTVLAGKEENLRLRLDVEAHSTDQETTLLRAVSDKPLPDLSVVELYNLSQTTYAKALVQSGDFSAGPLGAKSGEDLLAVVSPSDLDADDLTELSFVFSRTLASVSDPTNLVKLTDCGELNRAVPGPPGCPSPLPVSLNVIQEGPLVRARLFGPLARGHHFRLELKNLTSDGSPSVAYPPTDPSLFSFATRTAQSGPIGSTVGGGSFALGDTNSARDLLKFGNLLLVGSASGRLLAMDASDPTKPVLFARLAPGAGDQLRAFGSDGHNRLFYSVRLGSSWAIKAVRVNDVWEALSSSCPPRDPGDPAWMTALPCFAAVTGGVKSAFALGSTSGLVASEYLSVVGSMPTGTPSDLQILVADDTVGPYLLEEFFDKVPGSGTLPAGPPSSPDQFYSTTLTINTAGHVYVRSDAPCGEPSFDRMQRVTVDDLTTGQSWSVDVPNPSASGMTLAVAIRARRGDQIQVRYNKTAIGYLAIVGSGVSAFDLNRFYDSPTPNATTQGNKGECGRRLGTFEGGGISFPGCGRRAPPDSLAYTPALAVSTGAGFIDVLSVLTHFGAGNLGAKSDAPGYLDALEMKCLADTVPASAPSAPSPSPSYRAVTLALKATWIDRGIVPGSSPGTFVAPQPPFSPLSVRGDLAFYSLGPAGIDVFDVTERSFIQLIGRFWAKDHTVYRLAADGARRRLFAGGQDKNGNPIIDVWDISQANGGPSKDGIFPDPEGSADPRLLFTLRAPWDTNHIGLDESAGLLYTWGFNGPGAEGGFVLPTRDPGFIFSGLFRPESEDRLAGATPLPSIQLDTQAFVPLGVQTRVLTSHEADPEKSKADERNTTAAFKVRVSLPGTLGEKLVAKVQTLRSRPDARFLPKDDVGPLVASPGGGGWPDRDVFVTLRRLVPAGGTTQDQLQQPYNLYESDEAVLLLADPRAKLEYWKSKQDLKSPTRVEDEKTQCRRCGRPSYLPNDSGNTDIPVKELLAAGPW